MLAQQHNRREEWADPTAHAELLAIRDATRGRPGWRLEGATVCTSRSSRVRCAREPSSTRASRGWCSAPTTRRQARRVTVQNRTDLRLNHRFEVEAGCLAEECQPAVSLLCRAPAPAAMTPRSDPGSKPLAHASLTRGRLRDFAAPRPARACADLLRAAPIRRTTPAAPRRRPARETRSLLRARPGARLRRCLDLVRDVHELVQELSQPGLNLPSGLKRLWVGLGKSEAKYSD